MPRILPALLLFFLWSPAASADDPQVSAFDYELSLTSRPEGKTFLGFRSETKILKVRVESVKKVPGGSVMYPVRLVVANTPDGIDVNVATESPFTPSSDLRAREYPERGFYFEVKSLQLPENELVPFRLRFKDATDKYSLRYSKGQGLQLEAVDVKHGKIVASKVSDFVNMKTVDGQLTYQCNPLTISAIEAGKPKWSTDVAMRGQPEGIAVLDKVLFVKSTGGHSFYVMKDTGEILLYDSSVMAGKNPSDDVLALWERDMGRTYAEREKRGFFQFIKAAVMLDEKRSIPLMIRCVEDGFGLGEKCAAIAALEKFNGNPTLWPPKFPPPPSYFLKAVGMNKVFPEANAKAERAKWEKVFASYLQK
jgi:hypothetical protein